MINVILLIDQSVNSAIDAEKVKKRSGQAINPAFTDLVRAKDTLEYSPFGWANRCKKKTKVGNVKKTSFDWVVESINVDEEEFVAKFGQESTVIDIEIIGAWNWDGSQYGMTKVIDAETGAVSYTGTPVFPFNRALYLDVCPDIQVSEGVYQTALQVFTNTGYIQQIERNAAQQDRDFTVYV